METPVEKPIEIENKLNQLSKLEHEMEKVKKEIYESRNSKNQDIVMLLESLDSSTAQVNYLIELVNKKIKRLEDEIVTVKKSEARLSTKEIIFILFCVFVNIFLGK